MTFPVVIFHNEACGTSRNVLSIIRAAGHDPVIIDYRAEGWTRPHLISLFAAANVTARQALRISGTNAAELGLTEPSATEEQLIAAMLAQPLLVNRPLVCTPKGVRLCRPSEVVLDLLERLPAGPLAKEDGSLIIDAAGKRL